MWWIKPGGGRRVARACCKAESVSVSSMRLLTDQPTTRRENVSIKRARYSQPSVVDRYVISPTQVRSG